MTNPLQVVDLKNKDHNQLVQQMLNAATTQGFLFIDGHDFSQKEVDDLMNLSKEFFELPTAEKAKYAIDETNKGYSGLLSEKLDLEQENKAGDPKEAFNLGDITFSDGTPHQVLPQLFREQNNKEIIATTNKKLYSVVLESLQILAEGLKIDKESGGNNWFDSRHKPDEPNGSILRFLKYPSQSSYEAGTTIRAGAHTDYGTVTALFQFEGQEGLELYTNNKWQPVPFVSSKYSDLAPPLVVNFGDQLSYWTAGVLKSTIHRVKFPKKSIKENKDRYSIVFFSHPEHNTLLEPIPSDLVRSVKGRGANVGDVMTARQHLDRKLNATYFRNK